MKGTTFSESFSKPLIVPYNDMEMGPSFDMKLSFSYEKTFNNQIANNERIYPICSKLVTCIKGFVYTIWIICRIKV